MSLFTPGHSACAGCALPLAVRKALEVFGKNTIVVNATGCLEIVSTDYPHTAWRVPYIHSLFENAASVASGIEVALKKLGKNYNVLAIAGDGGTVDIGLQALSGAFERMHRICFICVDNEAYMNCLPEGTLIFTDKGVKEIEKIKSGDVVLSLNIKEKKIVKQRVKAVLFNGIWPVYEVFTGSCYIRATPNHPFLVQEKSKLKWKKLCELKVGDKIVILREIRGGFSYDLRKHMAYRKRKKKIKFPEKTNKNLALYLGLFLGDGWVRINKGEVGFAFPEGSEERELIINLNREIFGIEHNYETDYYVYYYSKPLASFLSSLGFNGYSREKDIPNWIFSLPLAQRQMFVEGLLRADGWVYDKDGISYRVVSASRRLLEKLKLLLLTLNYRSGKIHEQIRKKGETCVYRPLLKDCKWYYIAFSKRKKISRESLEKYPSRCKQRNYFADSNDDVTVEHIKEIRFVGYMPVYDLHVEQEHNFIANGAIVHNTGIQRSSATPYGAWTTTSPPGKLSIGKKEWKKDMPFIAAAHKIPYVATASIAHLRDYEVKLKKAKEKMPSYIHVHCPCPTGWRFPSSKTIDVAKLAVESGMWVLYEIEDGKLRITYKPKELKPVKDYLALQGRFKHLSAEDIRKIEETVKKEWERLTKIEESEVII